MNLYPVNAGYFKLDGGAMHGVVPKSMWQKANPADEQNMCSWAMRCLLIEHGDRLILVDTGMGDKQSEKFFSHYHPHGDDSLEKSITKAGFSLSDITDVFLTHLHFDHCGGAVKRDGEALVPAFPNATYWSNATHWEAALHPNAREKASFLVENFVPLQTAGKLKLITTGHGEEWIPGIRIMYVEGHTDHMMLPLIHYHGKDILYCADLFPSAAHLSLPWVMAYDMRPLDTLQEKETILKEAMANNWLLFFEHDPKISCCSLVETERGIRMLEAVTL